MPSLPPRRSGFALWRAVGELSGDPAAGLKIATQIDVANRPPSTMAAYYARDYRDALTRLARFKQLCSPEELRFKVSKDECVIEPVWLHAQEETPPLLTDAAFVSFVELGRRGTGHLVTAKRVELKRSAEATGFHEAYFKGPIMFGARRNALVLTRPISIGRSFLEARQELAHEYLNRPEIDVTEVAFLLGYEDSNSFYRAFRTWEGTTPSQLRAALRRSETRQ